MGFGISSFVKNLSLFRILLQIRRKKDLFINRKNNLRLSLSYNIANTKFGKNNFLGENVTLVNCNIDNHSYINSNSKIINTSIGKFCSIGSNVQIVLGIHPAAFVSTHPAFYSNNKSFETFSDKTYIEEYKQVEIGNDVWIAEGVIIPGGVKIGNGAIITARSVVTKDVKPYSIVGGVPAKHIRYRFEDDIIKKINHSEWWNWDENELKKKFKLFHDPLLFMKHLSNLE
jgi:acetyltransferase-like isoleucine patch superfamily enzyme